MQKKEINWPEIDTYLFDLGGVIVDISPAAAIEAFNRLGLKNLDVQITQAHHQGLFKQYELGAITTDEFIEQIQELLPQRVNDIQIINAWNEMIVAFRKERIEVVEKLKCRYPVYLLSNTNELHCKKYTQMADGYENAEKLFTEVFYSYKIKQSKPDLEAFKKVVEETGLNPSTTLFLDDSQINLNAAAQLGFQTLLISKEQTIEKLFSWL